MVLYHHIARATPTFSHPPLPRGARLMRLPSLPRIVTPTSQWWGRWECQLTSSHTGSGSTLARGPSYDTSWPSLPRAPVTPNNTPCQPSKQGSTATRRPHTKGSSLHGQGITPPRVVQCAGALKAVKRGHMTGTPPRVVQCAGALMAVKRGHMMVHRHALCSVQGHSWQ